MLNLIWANIFRLKKNAVFWGSIIVTIGFEIYYAVSQLLHYNKNHDSVSMDTICSPAGLQIIVILAAVTLSLFLGTEYSNKTIRNKQIAGHTRAGIYGAHLFTSLLAVTVLYLTDWVVSSVLISMLFKPSWPSLSSLLLLFFQG